ncbi:hypothetical protein E4U55_007826, partial [Claviceps digitariae]
MGQIIMARSLPDHHGQIMATGHPAKSSPASAHVARVNGQAHMFSNQEHVSQPIVFEILGLPIDAESSQTAIFRDFFCRIPRHRPDATKPLSSETRILKADPDDETRVRSGQCSYDHTLTALKRKRLV